MKKVIRCGHLFCVDEQDFIKDQDVYIEDDKIVDMTSGAALKEGYEVVDLSDKYVMPGLIDCHLHECYDGAPDVSYFAKMTVGDFAIEVMTNAQKDLQAGFTSVRDEGCFQFTDIAVRNAINSGKIDGPRMFCCGMPLGTTGGHCDSHFNPGITGGALGLIVDSEDEARKAVRYDLKYGAEHIKIMATGGVLSEGDDPGAPELTYKEMRAIVEECELKGIPSSAHTHGTAGIRMAVEAGITSIEHGTMADVETHELMIKKGTYLVPTLRAGYRIMKHGVEAGIPAEMVEKCSHVVDSHMATFKRAYEMGVKIAFGTDSGTPFNQHGTQAEEFELMVKQGMKPKHAIMSATKWASELIRWDKKVGSVEPGKFADIVAVDNNPLDDIKEMGKVTFVMKGGKVFKG